MENKVPKLMSHSKALSCYRMVSVDCDDYVVGSTVQNSRDLWIETLSDDVRSSASVECHLDEYHDFGSGGGRFALAINVSSSSIKPFRSYLDRLIPGSVASNRTIGLDTA